MVMYALTRNEFSEEIARRAVLYAAVFPTAFFFLAPYSESLFLLLVLLSFWSARRGRWAMAGATGALAALTRNLGVLVVPLDLEYLESTLGIGECLGDDGHAFLDGNHRPDTWFRERRTFVN